MALWKEQTPSTPAKPTPTPMASEPVRIREPESTPAAADFTPTATPAPVRTTAVEREVKESLIASDLTIEGKIEGTGHVRIAGKFKGDVNVQGNLTIELGAKLTGGVRASKVIIAGELEGNIDAAQRVELLESGVLAGDLKAGSLTVAAGSRMRGNVEFGWGDKSTSKSGSGSENGSGS
ncbi:polymer-forming cytoskeletal protein [Lysobacter sp. CFH 32150]|uniref:bactofilin family protein n=1 Tax=Lysobacter sp. CFH 32150 TaxID=2927128 RepID=UPI001FA73B63|nr:polymer-forming cytoskeletal protein [Lysobacter sp. CFH 32150]MCI4566721.1 polymer-forming cytoskeletal protein [Lysobacter sp. CFH 32150]